MTQDYEPLSEATIGAMKSEFDCAPDSMQYVVLAYLQDLRYWRARALAAEEWRQEHKCPMPITRGFEWTRGY